MAVKKRKRRFLKKNIDFPLAITVLVLVAIGIVVVFSASYYTAEIRENDAYFYVKKQLIGAAVGLVAMVVIQNIDYHLYAKFKWIIFLAAIGINLLVWVPGLGVNLNGAQRWIRIPVAGTMQPSEIAKIGLILVVSSELAMRSKCLTTVRGFLYILIVAGIMMIPVVLQKSLSVTIVIAITMVILMLIAGMRVRYLLATGALGIAGAAGLIFFSKEGQFRISRLMAYIDPWADPTNTGYQLVQSLYSLGSGGLFGLGLGQSRQKYLFLPYAESDFIFAIISEEFGYIGALIVLGIYGFLIYRCFLTALRAPDKLGTLIAAGIGGVMAVQVAMHILVVAGAIPPTGVPLPFMSAGSTSLVIFMAEMGIVLNISRYRTEPKPEKKEEEPEPETTEAVPVSE